MNRRQIVLGVVVGLAVVVVLLLGFLLGRSDGDSSSSSPRTITVTGTGEIDATPDVATIELGVSSTAKQARPARAAADAQLARVLAALRTGGIADADIQTSQLSLSPNFSRNGSTVVGYTAMNTVNAKIRDLDKAGAIVTAAARAGANSINGPTLTLSDDKAVYGQALEAAVADARSHAESIAAATGDTVGELRNASEGSQYTPVEYAVASKAADSANAPIEAGTLEVTATVTVSFEVE